MATSTTVTTTTAATTTTEKSTSLASSQAISSEATTVPIVGVKANEGEYSALHSDDFTVDNSSLIQGNSCNNSENGSCSEKTGHNAFA
ncbi:hypothetical protein DPMN_134881 [Dreissena polymorpha]|uniref:Uncharacterized protein n=1 Tax=Dreissena polymorpha TaxID=45954 RepID=A0A9D4FX09_DREPO|nr:hypothetical protein DPMN_134881 [Dreissena polymorpha]